ncbi:lytic transglycosylase domain-containing protein [Deferribacter abyssi]|uniref:lytic transglycosylase domain-containing protein n=1 Tax=Deferribacter abyssi TaxID=213806 RepID=UPI003C16704A
MVIKNNLYFMKDFLKVIFFTLLIFSLYINTFTIYLFDTINKQEFNINKAESKMAALIEEKEKARYLISKYNQIIDINNVLIYFTNGNVRYSTMDIAYTIVDESRKNKIDPYLVLSLILTESSFNHRSISRKGAIGLMQILPNTAYYISKFKDDIDISHKKELFDPITNIKIGVSYFAYLLKKYNGNIKYAIIAYNLGPSNLNYRLRKKKKVPKFYYNRVIRNYQLISNVKNSA